MSQYDHNPECRVVLITHGTSWWCLDCDTGVADLRAKPAEEHDVFLRYEQERNHYREKYHEQMDATVHAEAALREIAKYLADDEALKDCAVMLGAFSLRKAVNDLQEIIARYEKRKVK